jgi:hypothetical protein
MVSMPPVKLLVPLTQSVNSLIFLLYKSIFVTV